MIWDMARMVATTPIVIPKAVVWLSAGKRIWWKVKLYALWLVRHQFSLG